MVGRMLGALWIAMEACGLCWVLLVSARYRIGIGYFASTHRDESLYHTSRILGTTAVVTAASWNVAVLNSELPVLVEFFATWCGPCRMVDRVIDEIAEEYIGRVRCFKLNADYYPQLVNDHGVECVPTVLLFKNGKRLESITGTMPKYVYVGAIERSSAS